MELLATLVPVIVIVMGGIGWLIQWALSRKFDSRIGSYEAKNSAEHAVNSALAQSNADALATQRQILESMQTSVADLSTVVKIQTNLQHAVQNTMAARAAESDSLHERILDRIETMEGSQNEVLDWLKEHNANHNTSQ